MALTYAWCRSGGIAVMVPEGTGRPAGVGGRQRTDRSLGEGAAALLRRLA